MPTYDTRYMLEEEARNLRGAVGGRGSSASKSWFHRESTEMLVKNKGPTSSLLPLNEEFRKNTKNFILKLPLMQLLYSQAFGDDCQTI